MGGETFTGTGRLTGLDVHRDWTFTGTGRLPDGEFTGTGRLPGRGR